MTSEEWGKGNCDVHHHKTQKLKISAEQIQMPPQARTLPLTSYSKEGCKSVPITVSKQKKVTSPARPCHTEDGATAEGRLQSTGV